MKKNSENQGKTLSIRFNDELLQKVKQINLVTGKSQSTIIREFVKKGNVVLADEKELARQMLHVENAMNNHTLQVNDNLRRIKESVDSLRYAVRECSSGMDDASRRKLDCAIAKVEKVADDSDNTFRFIKETVGKGVNEVVDPYCGK